MEIKNKIKLADSEKKRRNLKQIQILFKSLVEMKNNTQIEILKFSKSHFQLKAEYVRV